MSNGIVSIPTVLLAALFVAIGGCRENTVSPPAPQSTIDARQAPSPVLRSLIDPARNRVWSLTTEGVFVHDVRTPEKIVEVALPSWSWVRAEYGCPPDLALGPGGEAVVTSNIAAMLWRIDPETLAVSLHELVLDSDNNKDVGFSGLAYSTEHGAFFAISDVHGSLWRIDPLLTTGQKLPLPAPIREPALCMKPQARLARAGN
jgi:hypothetical protein